MVFLETQGRGLFTAVCLDTAVKKEYGLHAKMVVWENITQDDGVIGLIVKRNPKKNGWDVLDHVLGYWDFGLEVPIWPM